MNKLNLTVFISFQIAPVPNSYGVRVSGQQIDSGRSGRDRPVHSDLRFMLQGPSIVGLCKRLSFYGRKRPATIQKPLSAFLRKRTERHPSNLETA